MFTERNLRQAAALTAWGRQKLEGAQIVNYIRQVNFRGSRDSAGCVPFRKFFKESCADCPWEHAKHPAPQIRLVRQLRALQVFVIHSFIHSCKSNLKSVYNFECIVVFVGGQHFVYRQTGPDLAGGRPGPSHRHRGRKGPPPQKKQKKNPGKYFSGKPNVKFGHFSSKCAKFGNFVNFLGANIV